MRVALVVFANKYTGAAAVAEHCCRALGSVGVEGRLLFVAGRNLERRLSDAPWADAGLVKEPTPFGLLRNLRAVRRIAADADVVVSHLPHDHALCLAAGVFGRTALVRSFRHRRHLGEDLWHRTLARRISGAVVPHSEMVGPLRRIAGQTPHLVLPVPLEDRFRPGIDPAQWRRGLELPQSVPVIGSVGKLARGRGFELLLATAAAVAPPVHVLLVGHGEHQPALERFAARLGLAGRVHWAGYQEQALPALYAAMDVVLFTAAGSDHGHRAISEAQACGRPVVAADIAGVPDLIEDGVTGRIVQPAPEALAAAVTELVRDPSLSRLLGSRAAEAVTARRFVPAGRRLAAFLEDVRRYRAPRG